jgi:putative membrane-bound dehydrogenase-like protein
VLRPLIALSFSIAIGVGTANAEDPPKSLDPRYQLIEFAAAPDIVTPTGMTVDEKGRVWAIESHTHFRPENYDGPKTDRIKVFEDTDGDGRADKHTIFLEAGKATMGIGVHPINKCIYIAERSKITRYWDDDGDLKPEKHETIIVLETKGDYPHNGLSGFAFDANGNVYFGLGENLGEKYRVMSKYGPKHHEGGGEGGSVFCCSEKGSDLRMVATGFWNPFHLCFNAEGRLFTVDNDPDSRPPCRLIHIVEGGDYGYRFRNGRKGLHPFTAWNGELPGTLPMLAGTGEAPSGVIEDLIVGGSLLVTSWGDHCIERYSLEKSGGSYSAKKLVVAQGGENFRPVGIGQDAKGNIYFTDWVLKDYNLHKQGRIWLLKPLGAQRVANRGVVTPVLEWVGEANPRFDSTDPFERHAAQNYIAMAADWVRAKNLSAVQSPIERAEWAVAMRRKTPREASRRIPEILADTDWLVRFVGIQWIGEERLTEFENLLRENLQKNASRREEMEATLVALKMLAGEETKTQDEQGADAIVLKMVLDEASAAYSRARALRYLRPDHPKLTIELLKGFLNAKDEDLKLEAIRTLSERGEAEAQKLLLAVALDESLPSQLRAEATAGLTLGQEDAAAALAKLSKSPVRAVAIEASRKLRKEGGIEPWSGEAVLQDLRSDKEIGGDPQRGSRFFFTSQQKCARCHTHDGRGANVGPDLTRIAENRDAAKIAESILHPSKEIAPQFAVYQLELTSGVVKSGVYLGATAEGKQRFVDAESNAFEVDSAEIAIRNSLPSSLMPEDISKRMSREEFLDLVAFLAKK